jgi:hypothetical protein
MAMNNDKRMIRRIAHLHGTFNPADSIILSIEDYERAYGLNLTDEEGQEKNQSKLRFRLLWAVLATRRVVFVGFSMEDPYFKKMLEIVSTDLWGWDKSIHFAVIGISTEDPNKDSKDKAKRFKNNYGVDTVFYEVFKEAHQRDSHQRLEDLFVEIAGQCESRSQLIGQTQDLSDDRDPPESEEPRSVANRSRDILNWIKRESQRMIKGMGDED